MHHCRLVPIPNTPPKPNSHAADNAAAVQTIRSAVSQSPEDTRLSATCHFGSDLAEASQLPTGQAGDNEHAANPRLQSDIILGCRETDSDQSRYKSGCEMILAILRRGTFRCWLSTSLSL